MKRRFYMRTLLARLYTRSRADDWGSRLRRPPKRERGRPRHTHTHTIYGVVGCRVSAGGIGKASPPAMPSLARSSRRGCARGGHGPTYGMPPGASVKEEAHALLSLPTCTTKSRATPSSTKAVPIAEIVRKRGFNLKDALHSLLTRPLAHFARSS